MDGKMLEFGKCHFPEVESAKDRRLYRPAVGCECFQSHPFFLSQKKLG
jgi:hypothetical protein